MDRVYITGIGCVTPIGHILSEITHALETTQSGISSLDSSFHPDIASRVVGRVSKIPWEGILSERELKRTDRCVQMALISGLKAWEDAGFDLTASSVQSVDRDRVGIVTGIATWGVETSFEQMRVYFSHGPRKVSPFFIPMILPNMAGGMLGIRLGLQGENFATVSACASSAHALGEAFCKIRRGEADVMLAGGAEAAISDITLAGFCAMHALSTRYNDQPEAASRPFDRGRDGFVLAEGAGFVVLESKAHAERRGASPYGELLGYGASADAYHMVHPAPEGKGAQLAMRRAISDARVPVDVIRYINAHGTGTPIGDEVELQATSRVMGTHAPNVYVSSTKSMTGHMLGATGVCELIFSLLALRQGFFPPTRNMTDPMESFGLQLVGPTPHPEKDMSIFMSNAFGFGGTNVSLVVRPLDTFLNQNSG